MPISVRTHLEHFAIHLRGATEPPGQSHRSKYQNWNVFQTLAPPPRLFGFCQPCRFGLLEIFKFRINNIRPLGKLVTYVQRSQATILREGCKMKANLLAIGTLMALSAGSLLAVGPCPTSTGGSTGAAYTTAGGGCNVIITFNLDGSIVTTVPNANPYDGSDDQLVGIVNLSRSAITTISLSSTTLALFGFDGDGACSGTYVLGAVNCPLGSSTTGGNDY